MNLPEWLKLSATSGTGSGTIKATADPCTARSAKRTTSFSVKTDSGSSRQVKVIQNGIPEFVKIEPNDDIIRPAVTGGSDRIAVTGTSNSAILTVSISGTVGLKPSSYMINDAQNNFKTFVSGSPIEGDPGANAQYSFTLIFTYGDNVTTNELESSIIVTTQSGSSASVKVKQMAGESSQVTYPVFTDNSLRTVSAAGDEPINPAIMVYDPQGMGWDILCVPATGVTITEGPSIDGITTVNAVFAPNADTENAKNFVMYLVPQGAQSTSITYSRLDIRQLAAPVNPYIEGEPELRSYAGGLVTLNVVDQKRVGWYPQSVFGANAGTVLITGTSDRGISYTDAPDTTVFAQETNNTKIVGNGTVKVHINNASETGEEVFVYLRVSSLDVATEPYDYSHINIANIPQFNVAEYEIVLNGTEGNKIDTGLFIANPENVPFTVYTTGNAGNKYASVLANGTAVPDAFDEGAVQQTYTGNPVELTIDATSIGEFTITLKPIGGASTFDTIRVGIYRVPVVRFSRANDDGKSYITAHVTESIVNVANVYASYSALSGYREGYFADEDMLYGMNVTYNLADSNNGNYVTLRSDTGEVTCRQGDPNAQFNDIIVVANIPANGFYKATTAQYTIRLLKTKAYVVLTGMDTITLDGVSYMKKTLYLPDINSTEYPSRFVPNFRVEVDDYRGGTPVRSLYTDVFGGELGVTYTMPSEGFLEQEGNEIVAKDFPPNGNAFGQVSISPNANDKYVDLSGESSFGNNVFLVFVEQNTSFELQLVAGWARDDEGGRYLFENATGGNEDVSVSLFTTLGENQNSKPVNHYLAVRDDRGYLYNYENSSRVLITDGGVSPYGYTVTRNSSSTSINESASSRSLNVAISSLGAEEDTVTIIAYADAQYTKPLASSSFKMSRHKAIAKGYQFTLDAGDEQWWQSVIAEPESRDRLVGIYAAGGSHSFNVALLDSKNEFKGVRGKAIAVTKKFYTAAYDSSKSFFDNVAEASWAANQNSWVRPTVDGAEVTVPEPEQGQPFSSSYSTGENGYPSGSPTPPMAIEWQQNSETDVLRRCDVSFYLVEDPDNCNTSYSFVQHPYGTYYAVLIHDNDKNVDYQTATTREVEIGYSEVNAAFVGKLCNLNNGTTELSGASYEYWIVQAQQYPDIEINQLTGKLTLGQGLVAGTEVDVHIDGKLNDAVVASNEYRLKIKAATIQTDIIHNVPTTATYRDPDMWLEAYATSGATVQFSTNSSKVTLGIKETVEAVRNGESRRITRQKMSIIGASARNTAETITMSCEATDTFSAKTITAQITIAQYDDYVVSWSGPTSLTVGQDNIFTVTTGTGMQPRDYSFLMPGDTIPGLEYIVYSKTSTGFKIKPLTTGTVTVVASLDYDGYNGNYSRGKNNSIKLTTQSATGRSVSFTGTPYNISVNGTPTQLTWAFNPSYANSGTPNFTYDENDIQLTQSGGKWYVNGLRQCSTTLVMVVPQSGAYTRCETSTTINVGLKPTTGLVWVKRPTNIEVGDTSQMILAQDDNWPYRTVTYRASDDSVVGFTYYGGKYYVNPKKAGSTRVYADVAANDEYASATIYYDIAIISSGEPPVPVTPDCTISFTNPSATYTVGVGSTFTKAATATPSDATITYSSSDSTVATVNSSGQVTGVKAGGVTITAIATKAGYNSATAAYSISVTPASVTTPVITVANRNIQIYLPNDDEEQYPTTANLNASVNNNVQTVKYQSLDTDKVQVMADGTVRALAKGANIEVRVYVEATGSYGSASTSASVTVSEAPTSGGGETVDDIVDFTNTYINQTVNVLMGDKFYNPAVATRSGRPVFYSTSNIAVANILYARVEAPSAISNSVVTLTTSANQTLTFKVTAGSSSTSKNGTTLEWTTDAQSLTVKTGDVFYVHAAILDTGGSKASWYSNNTGIRWAVASGSTLVVNGGVVQPKSASSNAATVKAMVYAGVVNGVNYSDAYDTYYVTTSYKIPSLRFTYEPSDLMGEGANEFSFARGSVLPSDFNAPIYDSIHSGSFEWLYNGNGSSNTGIATVNPNTGVVTIGNDTGRVTIGAAIAAHGDYQRVEVTYDMIITAYKVELYRPNGNILLPTEKLSVGGQGGSVTVRAKYFKTVGGAGDLAYDDTPNVEGGCSNIAPKSSSYAPDPQSGVYFTSDTLSAYHDITYHFGRNMSGESYDTDRTIYSNIGSAAATVVITRGAGGGGHGDPEHAQYVITRSDSTVVEENHYWGTGGFAFGDERLIPANYAGTDETYATDIAQDEGQKLSRQTASGSYPQLWWEVQDWYKSGSDKRIDTSSGRVAIQYEVLISEDGNTWTNTSSDSWFWGYLGDGNSQSTSTDIKLYGAGGFLLNAQNKFYPHIAWTANESSSPRYGKVILYFQQSGDYKMGRVEIMFIQQGTNS